MSAFHRLRTLGKCRFRPRQGLEWQKADRLARLLPDDLRSPFGKLIELLGFSGTLLCTPLKLLGKFPVERGKVSSVRGLCSPSLLDGARAVIVGIVGHGARTTKTVVRSSSLSTVSEAMDST